MRSGVRRVALLAVAVIACGGRHEGPGEIAGGAVPAQVVEARAARQNAVAPPRAKQILFGDLHVHTTFSIDAFNRSLPFLQGEGAHPPADACDFARYCSDLDFWSINDHAEALTPQHWRETKESIRQCNQVAGDPSDPDVVAFLGWEWTQVGATPEDHFGHKNVILRELAEDRVPTRPISARDGRLVGALLQDLPLLQRLGFLLNDLPNRQRYLDRTVFMREVRDVPLCPEGVDVRELSEDCHEVARTPGELFEKLDQWDLPALVIPHGTTWGFYTPPGTSFDKQLTRAQHDPERQTLFEVYSGHGNSEEYRDWRAAVFDEDGEARCPEPSADYLPCCWRAGELIRARCEDPASADCERRVEEARRNYLEAGAAGHHTVPGANVEDWLDCGQCRDCFNPSFNYRPGNSAQYTLALSNFEEGEDGDPLRFRFGFMASSDNHTARPGTGYKEYGRRRMTEAAGARSAAWRERLTGPAERPLPASIPAGAIQVPQPFLLVDVERQMSFFMTGGLVAVHAEGRDRSAIWDAFDRREVYGTSGDRILLWFELLNGPDGPLPMGSEAALAEAPRFRVRAVGAFEQEPGCPPHAVHALTPERLEFLCRGECYHPGEERRRITRIEVIRVQPQARPDEPVGRLVQDPWRRLDCLPDRAGCEVEFEDPDFVAGMRDSVYYVRAIQEPTPAVNAGGLRCERDASGACLQVRPCYGDYRTPYDEDCLWPNEERAWSSPIWLRPLAPPETEQEPAPS